MAEIHPFREVPPSNEPPSNSPPPSDQTFLIDDSSQPPAGSWPPAPPMGEPTNLGGAPIPSASGAGSNPPSTPPNPIAWPPQEPPQSSLPPIPPTALPYNVPLSVHDEHTWAMLAHLSVLVNLFTGFLGPVAALVIYLVFKDRSRYVAFQAMQSFVFQLVAWIGGGILAAVAWAISGALAVVLVGFCLMPIALVISLLPLAALVYGVIGAVQTNQGQDFRYWLVGDWLKGMA